MGWNSRYVIGEKSDSTHGPPERCDLVLARLEEKTERRQIGIGVQGTPDRKVPQRKSPLFSLTAVAGALARLPLHLAARTLCDCFLRRRTARGGTTVWFASGDFTLCSKS
jgi:hypothetical protein